MCFVVEITSGTNHVSMICFMEKLQVVLVYGQVNRPIFKI